MPSGGQAVAGGLKGLDWQPPVTSRLPGLAHDRARILATADRRILEAFSRRTVEGLRAAVPLRIALPQIEKVLALNVAKEAQKDALVIRCSADALAAGSPPGPDRLRQLFEETKVIERGFLRRVTSFPVGVVINYDEVGPVRRQRIERLSLMAYRILDAWQHASGLRAALRASHTQPEFERALSEILQLYARETSALSRSVRLPALLKPLRERLARSVVNIMNDAGSRLTRDLSRAVY